MRLAPRKRLLVSFYEIKKVELFFTTILVPVDFLMIFLAGITAYQLRFSDYYRGVRPVIFNLPFDEYFGPY